jgi:pimeloyl-ACP methyl ester carboxylesterase
MATFVFIHGGFHGGWCWHKVTARLEAQGHRAIAPDMPGHGIDPTPRHTVTMDLIVSRLCELIDSIEGQVVLVGHSLGGAVISNIAERRPEKIERLYYVTAFLLPNGDSTHGTLQRRKKGGPESGLSDDGAQLLPSLDSVRELFYHLCSEDDVALAKMLLVPENAVVALGPVSVTPERWGSIPRYFVECTADRAIPPELQRKMHVEMGCARYWEIPAEHSPFFSQPDALVEILLTR